MPSACRLIVRAKFTISIPRESCTNAKAKYSSSVVPPDPSVHFYYWMTALSVCGLHVMSMHVIYS